jgi:outer membrane receptor protein involved in Fe transport
LPMTSYGQWSMRMDYAYKSKIQFGTLQLIRTPFKNAIAAPGFGLLSGRISLSKIPLSGAAHGRISVFAENLTNKKYRYQGIDFGFAGVNVFGQRRTVGVEGAVEF